MIALKPSYKLVLLILFMLSGVLGFSQNNKQKQLESRRQELRREIQKINSLRAENKSKEKITTFLN